MFEVTASAIQSLDNFLQAVEDKKTELAQSLGIAADSRDPADARMVKKAFLNLEWKSVPVFGGGQEVRTTSAVEAMALDKLHTDITHTSIISDGNRFSADPTKPHMTLNNKDLPRLVADGMKIEGYTPPQQESQHQR